MKQFQDKNTRRRRFYSIWTVAILVVVAFILMKAVFNIYLKQRESAKLRSEAAVKLADLQGRYDRLAAETERLKTESGIEEEIREKFSVGKPGEKMVLIVADEGGVQDEEEKNVIMKFFRKLRGMF